MLPVQYCTLLHNFSFLCTSEHSFPIGFILLIFCRPCLIFPVPSMVLFIHVMFLHILFHFFIFQNVKSCMDFYKNRQVSVASDICIIELLYFLTAHDHFGCLSLGDNCPSLNSLYCQLSSIYKELMVAKHKPCVHWVWQYHTQVSLVPHKSY